MNPHQTTTDAPLPVRPGSGAVHALKLLGCLLGCLLGVLTAPAGQAAPASTSGAAGPSIQAPAPKPATAESAAAPQLYDPAPIRITRRRVDALQPLLRDGYRAYGAGRLEEAQQHYRALIRQDRHNTDALLGLAAIALQQDDQRRAEQYYARVLALDPHNAWAQAGMAALTPDASANESRLKLLLDQQGKAAVLHFALGNAYAAQARWGEARVAFADAVRLAPGDAGFAYNLAVSLDHLGREELAAHYYRAALQLDPANRFGLDRARIAQRISYLSE